MKRDYFKNLKQQLEEIKKEGKVENIDISMCDEELEEREINEPTQRKFKTSMLKKGLLTGAAAIVLATGLTNVPSTSVNDNMTVVEAKSKKDKKKPSIKFSGKTNISVEKGKSVKIPKTTAKDNVDGNVTKKLKVTVKKGKKSYSSIAKKIKSNKSVKFTQAGKYVITYTVTDKAGNKATKKRYVTVTEPIETTTYNSTPTTEATTEKVTTETPTTEKTTEAATTETSTEYVAPAVDLSKYANIEKITVNGITYNFATELYVEEYKGDRDFSERLDFSNIETKYTVAQVDIGLGNNSKYKEDKDLIFKIIKKITLKNNGIDNSNNVFIYKPNDVMYYVYYVYEEKLCFSTNILIFNKDYDELKKKFEDDLFDEQKYIDDENELIIYPTVKDYNISLENSKVYSYNKNC